MVAVLTSPPPPPSPPPSQLARLSHHPGRSLRWDAQGRRWWWAGSDAHAVHACAERQGAPLLCRLPDAAGLLAHCRSGRMLLGLAKRLGLAQPDRQAGARQLRLDRKSVV